MGNCLKKKKPSQVEELSESVKKIQAEVALLTTIFDKFKNVEVVSKEPPPKCLDSAARSRYDSRDEVVNNAWIW
ncbi:unknown [Feldmannia species virus]|uniref:Uncharacterized protein n=1 Tax=Feldmannia species virus TaxID=39420 RepID=B5LWJ9_9PHYC|nr:hypothetical protein FeldSpV_gp110 [Feldmannia species virus]ACH46862.1 unknown [Feldmannia species virus]